MDQEHLELFLLRVWCFGVRAGESLEWLCQGAVAQFHGQPAPGGPSCHQPCAAGERGIAPDCVRAARGILDFFGRREGSVAGIMSELQP